jgi:hypothetical protein
VTAPVLVTTLCPVCGSPWDRDHDEHPETTPWEPGAPGWNPDMVARWQAQNRAEVAR